MSPKDPLVAVGRHWLVGRGHGGGIGGCQTCRQEMAEAGPGLGESQAVGRLLQIKEMWMRQIEARFDGLIMSYTAGGSREPRV